MRRIEILIDTSGRLKIEAMNFQGPDCEKATRFVEEALGERLEHTRKSEYHAQVRTANRQQATQGGA